MNLRVQQVLSQFCQDFKHENHWVQEIDWQEIFTQDGAEISVMFTALRTGDSQEFEVIVDLCEDDSLDELDFAMGLVKLQLNTQEQSCRLR